MNTFMIISQSGETLYVEADNFEISGQWVLFTSEKESVVELAPMPKTAFVAACKDVFAFYAVDDEGNQMDLLR